MSSKCCNKINKLIKKKDQWNKTGEVLLVTKVPILNSVISWCIYNNDEYFQVLKTTLHFAMLLQIQSLNYLLYKNNLCNYCCVTLCLYLWNTMPFIFFKFCNFLNFTVYWFGRNQIISFHPSSLLLKTKIHYILSLNKVGRWNVLKPQKYCHSQCNFFH